MQKSGIFTFFVETNTIKTLKHIIRNIVAAIIVFTISSVVLLHHDTVRHRIAGYLSNILQNEIKIPVTIGSIDYCFPNKLVADSVLLNGTSKDTIADIPQITASFDFVSFLCRKNIKIYTVTLSKPKIKITKQSPSSPSNIQFLIDAFANNDSTSDSSTPDIRINQLHIYDGSISYDVLSMPDENDRLTLSHIKINDLQTNISLRKLDSDTVSIYLRHLSFKEKSGFAIRKLKAHINGSSVETNINKLNLHFANSNIYSENITLFSFEETSGNEFGIKGRINDGNINLNDLSPFFPQLTDADIPLRISTTFNGTDDTFEVEELKITSTKKEDLNIETCGKIENPKSDKPRYRLQIKNISAESHLPAKIFNLVFNGKEMPEEIKRLGKISIAGNLSGTGKVFDGHAEIQSDAGTLSAELKTDDKGCYQSKITAENINIGKIADDDNWGFCKMETKIEGNNIGSENHSGIFNTTINTLQYKQYTYSPIRLHGTFSNEQANILAALNDSNLQMRMAFNYDNDEKLPRYELNMRIDSLRPYNLNISEDNESDIFSFNMESELIGKSTEHSRINTNIYDFTHQRANETNKIRRIHLSANFLEKEKSIIINSDFINGYLTGYYKHNTLVNSLKFALQRALPSLFEENHLTETENNFVFHFNINNTETLTKIFNFPLTIKEQSIIQGSCNDMYKTFVISGFLKGFEYGERKYRKIDFNSKFGEENNNNTITAVRIPMPDDSEDYNPDNEININITSDIRNDSAFTNIKWENIDTPINKGDLNVDVAISRNIDNNLCFTTLFHKSDITQNDTIWNLSPCSISGSGGNLKINNFSLHSNNQHIRINGKLGKDDDDNLDIDLRHINMGYVFDLLDFHPVNLDGEVSGKISASSILENIRFNSNLQIKNLTFERGRIGDLAFNGYWDENQKAIILKGDAKENSGAHTVIDGFVSPALDTLNICIDASNTRIEFLNNLVSSFIEDADGIVSGKLYLLGGLRNVNMQGALAPLGRLKIKPINTVYNLIGDTIYFTHNKIGFDGFHITDNHGNSGLVHGGIFHQSLKRFTCDFHINANNLQAFHYPDFGEDSFYGTAFVTGDAELSVNQSGINLKANVHTGPGSKFIYNAGSPEGNISNEFVMFTDRRKRKSLISDTDKFKTETIADDNINSQINLDFMIDVTPEMQLRVYTNQASNDYIDLYGSGTVNAIYDEKAGFSMKGNLGINRGTYKFTLQDIFPKEFSIRSGSNIAFNGDPFLANLNLKTVYTIPSVPLTDLSIDAERRKNVKVNCFMDITGTIFTPNLSFDIELPDGNEEEKELLTSAISTPEQLNMQFIYLLGIGKFYTYDYNNQKNESQSSTAMESLISNTISGQLNNMLSQIIDNGNWNISGNFTTSEKGWNSMEVEGMLSGRLLDNRLLINGNLGYRDNPMANKNFISDFEVQWLLNKNGNISLKAYNKTNDRYFSKTTLTTQGAGILLKREFDGWRFWKK